MNHQKNMLKVFSDKEPGTDGPYRFSRKELEDLFGSAYTILELADGIADGPRKPQCYVLLMEKK